MRIGWRFGPRSILVLVLGIPLVLWQAYRTQDPVVLVAGLAGMIVVALVLSVTVIGPRRMSPSIGQNRTTRVSPIRSDVEPEMPTRVVAQRAAGSLDVTSSTRPTPVTLSPSSVNAQSTPLSVPVRRPSTGPLKAQIDHNRSHLETVLLNPSAEESAWIQLGPDIKQTFAEELAKIRPFVDEVLVVLRPGGYLQLQNDINEASTLLSTGSWCAGRSAARNHPALRASLATITAEEISVIPSRFRGPVEDAIEYAHWVFASVFHPYYASVYGEASRGERDGHFLDMYRTFTRVAVLSFLAGVRSV